MLAALCCVCHVCTLCRDAYSGVTMSLLHTQVLPCHCCRRLLNVRQGLLCAKPSPQSALLEGAAASSCHTCRPPFCFVHRSHVALTDSTPGNGPLTSAVCHCCACMCCIYVAEAVKSLGLVLWSALCHTVQHVIRPSQTTSPSPPPPPPPPGPPPRSSSHTLNPSLGGICAGSCAVVVR